uniref:GH25 family lysozyme n=1 Tax=Ndongobacter massiliensis TaxID=1871025 RepID=UPI000930ED18|nr:GH25 family lysozyme [Ndongobacter massiliensis]
MITFRRIQKSLWFLGGTTLILAGIFAAPKTVYAGNEKSEVVFQPSDAVHPTYNDEFCGTTYDLSAIFRTETAVFNGEKVAHFFGDDHVRFLLTDGDRPLNIYQEKGLCSKPSAAPDSTEIALEPNLEEAGEWEELVLCEKDGLIYFEIQWDAKQDILLSVERGNGEDTDTLYLRATDKLVDAAEDETSEAPAVAGEEAASADSASERENPVLTGSEPVREELPEESTEPTPEVKDLSRALRNTPQPNSWYEANGKRYYVDANGNFFKNQFISFGEEVRYYMGSDGSVQYGILQIGGKVYYADLTTGIIQKKPGWIEVGNRQYYADGTGTLFQNRVISFADVLFCMGSDGSVQHGLTEINGNYYYADPETGKVVQKQGWLELDGKRYYIGPNGVFYRNQKITFGSIGYCMGCDGAVQFGPCSAGGALYFTDLNTGVIVSKPGWYAYEGRQYYAQADGRMFRNQIITFGSKVAYYIGYDGSRRSGLIQVDSKLYYAAPDTGIIARKQGWLTIGAKRYYANDRGELYYNQLISFGSTVAYYMGPDGSVQSGIIETGANLYYADPQSGIVQRRAGWITWNGKRYYSRSDGRLFRDQFISFGDSRFYMQHDGSVATGLVVINGKEYQFDKKTGELIVTGKILVMDVSYWQNPNAMNFDRIAQQIGGVILRIGYTGHESLTQQPDSTFETYYREFKKRGVPVGCYFYSCASTVPEGIREANFVINRLRGKQLELPVYWDTEDEYHQRGTSRAQLTDTALAFLSTLRNARYYCGIYSSTSWLYDELDMSRLQDYEVWVAHYGVSKPGYSGNYGMWQFTSQGQLDGFSHDLDLSYMYKDYPSIIKDGHWNGF